MNTKGHEGSVGAAHGGWTVAGRLAGKGAPVCGAARPQGAALPLGFRVFGVFRGGPRVAQRGSVIILVLVTVMLAAFLLTTFLRRTGTELLADARAAEQRQLRAEAYSALETALAVLADFRAAEGALRSPAESWGQPFDGSGYEPAEGRVVTIGFEDESGKLSLPQATIDELQAVLELCGVERNAADRMARTLHAWLREAPADTAADFDTPDYTRADPPYKPAGRSLRSWGELAAVEFDRHLFFDEDGQPTEILEAFRREVSLHSFQTVNLNSAQAGVLTARGLGSAEIGALEDYRLRPKPRGETGVFRSAVEAATALGGGSVPPGFGTNIEALRINVSAQQGGVIYRLSVVVAAGSGARGSGQARTRPEEEPGEGPETAVSGERKVLNYPFAVLEIREDSEPFAPTPSPTT